MSNGTMTLACREEDLVRVHDSASPAYSLTEMMLYKGQRVQRVCLHFSTNFGDDNCL